MKPVVIKLGGRLLAGKELVRGRPRLHVPLAARLARELASASHPLVVLHGAGGFGHPKAGKLRLKEGLVVKDARRGAAEVMEDMRTMNLRLLRCLRVAGLAPVSIPPSGFGPFPEGADRMCGTARRWLALGLTPVSFGDVVMDPSGTGTVTILSADTLFRFLAPGLGTKEAYFVFDVDGILDENGKHIPHLLPAEIPPLIGKLKRLRPAGGNDVTGGIIKKLAVAKAVAEDGVRVVFLNGGKPGRLRDTLRGKSVTCTVVER